MAGENIALAGIRETHARGRTVGVAALKPQPQLSDERLRAVVKDAVERGMRRAEQKAEAANVSKAVDLFREWRGNGGDELRKRAPDDALSLIKVAHRHPIVEATGEPVAEMRKFAAEEELPLPDGAYAEVTARRDALKLAKSGGAWVDDARIREAQDLANALGEPIVRAPLSPHRDGVTAAEGAAALIGGNPDEYMTAVRDNDAHWLERIRERDVAEAIKCVRPIACGMAPPRFRRA